MSEVAVLILEREMLPVVFVSVRVAFESLRPTAEEKVEGDCVKACNSSNCC